MTIRCPKCGSLNLKNDLEYEMSGICFDCGYIDLANKFISSNKIIKCKVEIGDGVRLFVVSADGEAFKYLDENEFVDLNIICNK